MLPPPPRSTLFPYTTLFRSGFKWDNPELQERITMEDAIGHLPTLESGEKSNIKNHYSRTHTESHIRFMKNTPTGKSDRKSTRLNSSHVRISYAVFCLKKKKK